MRVAVTMVAALALLAGGDAARAAGAAVDPKLVRALDTGLWEHSGRRLRPPAARWAPAVIELAGPVDVRALARLEAAGARLYRASGHPVRHLSFVPARVDRRALAALARLPGVRRVSLLPPRGPLPLDHSAELLGLAAARGARPALDLLTGEGVVIADLDTNADVFHPHFFRADAGLYDWIDVDGDGRFTPGVDAIDLDRNGRADPGETASLLRADTYYVFTGQHAGARGAGFDPGVDWLYLDENGNGRRDFGADAGFDDTVPALGEPLFVPDDLDRSGTLDPGEKVIRLGTSKFRKLWANLSAVGGLDHVFERGVDLAAHVVNYTDGVYGYSDGLHGTGVLSIVAGDVPLAGRRWVGVAPDADLVLGWEYDLPVAGTTWALAEGATVVLYELSPWTGLPLDGSDPLSQLIDDSTATDQVTHTCPVGNQAAARKHARGTLDPGAPLTLPFDLPAGLHATYVQVSFNVRGAGAAGVGLTLQEPGGQVHPLGSGNGTLSTGAYFYPTLETTSRGTRFVDVILYANQPTAAPLPTGRWQAQLTVAATATVDAYVSDEVSGFGPGVAFDAADATDMSTIAAPSTADHCIAVAAHTGHRYAAATPWFYDYPPGGPGEVRDYSAWGPRLDGAPKPDVAAPDNPFVAAPNDETWGSGPTVIPHGAFWPFGGTSGASPHVTGVAALLWQAGVRGDDARQAIRDGATSDTVTGPTPNDRYGWGRLSAAGALGVAADGAPPTLTVAVTPATARPGQAVTLTPTATDPDGPAAALELRWDDGYDGTWDTEYGPVAPRTVTSPVPATLGFKARVRDASGRFSEALARVTFSDTAPVGDGGAPDAGADAGLAGGGHGCGCRADAAATAPGVALVLLAVLGCRSRRRRRPTVGPSGGRTDS